MKFLVGFVFLCFQCLIFAQGFVVNEYKVDVYLSEEGYFDVEEYYDIEFTIQKHGIIRDIITKYEFQLSDTSEITKREIYISNVDVSGGPYTTSSHLGQKYETSYEIKIGDKNKTVIGPMAYSIKYRVENAFIFKDNVVQFYWNLKPDGWNAEFKSVQFRVFTPDGAELSDENSFIYYDSYLPGLDSNFELSYENGVFEGRSLPDFRSNYGQSVTVLIKLPKEMIAEVDYSLPWWQKYSWIAITVALWVWIKSVRRRVAKPDKITATTSYYPPDEMDPAVAGYIIDDFVHQRDLVSLLPYWGQKGIITIQDIPKEKVFGKADVSLTKVKELNEDAASYEKIMFEELFKTNNTVLISSLANTFYTTMNKAQKSLESAANLYYDTKANKKSTNIGALFIISSFAVGFLFFYFYSILAAIVGSIAVIVASISFFKKKKSPKGNRAFSELLGFREFIKVAELNRIKMLLEDDPDYFEKTMSYAVAFNLLKEWSGKFDELGVEPPNWYSSAAGPIAMSSFGNAFTNSMNTTRSNFVSAPASSSSGGSFGGGGSSGGGFGGGGGGSW